MMHAATSLEAERERAERLALARLLTFGAAVAGIALGFVVSPWLLLALGLPGAGLFAWAVGLHRRALARVQELEVEAAVLREREDRQGRRRLRPAPEPVEEYGIDLDDPPPATFQLDPGVADDLDLLAGPRSLFGFLDASSTWFGTQRLLGMLRRPLLTVGALRDRQAAVRWAAETGTARDALLRALFPLRRHRLEAAAAALGAETPFAGRTGLLLWAHLWGTACPLLLALTFHDLRFGALLTLVLILNAATVGLHSSRSSPARDRLLALGPFLEGLAAARAVLAAHPPEGSAWARAAAGLESAGRPGRSLARWVRLLSLHELGILFEGLNLVLLWELRLLPTAEKLLAGHREELRRAGRALGEAEALLSLSLPLAEGEGFTLPVPVEASGPLLEARGLGHPLIAPAGLVRNDLRLDAESPIALITGSNMSGKSTLLKSVGVNVVLAGMGGPVCAASLRFTPLAVLSDINVRDSLDDGQSYFAVEVERVRRVLEQAGRNPFLLGVLDELFRGTNSAERQAIAMALLSHLRRAGGLYLVATHDLGITRLAEEVPGISNFHFREEVDGQAMRFDYRLRPGPAPTRNAIRVLEARGYPESLVREARRRLKG